MNLSLMAMLGWPEIIGILVVVLVLFGAKKLPELARGLGQGLKEFKKATKEVQDDLQRAIEEDPPAEPPRRVIPKSTVERDVMAGKTGPGSGASDDPAERPNPSSSSNPSPSPSAVHRD